MTLNRLIRQSIEKPVYKEKLRVRSYGTVNGNSTVFFEIKKKFDDLVFTKTLMSDLVRCSLLAENGGLWLDATVFVSKAIMNDVANMPFYTVVRNEAKEKDISNKISPFLIGGCDTRLFCFMRDMLYEYVRNETD